MAKNDVQGVAGSTAKPLSAWEKRKQYSKQLNTNAQRSKQNATIQTVCQNRKDDKGKDDEGSVMRPAGGPTKRRRLGVTAAPVPSASKTTVPLHKPGPSKQHRGALKPSGRPTTSTKSQRTVPAVKNTKPAPSMPKAVVQTKKVIDRRPLSEVAKQKNTTKPTVKSNDTKVAGKKTVPMATSSSAKVPSNGNQGPSGKRSRPSRPAVPVRRLNSQGAASKPCNDWTQLSKPQTVPRKPAKDLKVSMSKPLHPRKSILASGRREADKAKRVSMKMTPETMPPMPILDNSTPKGVPFPNSAEEFNDRKLSKCAGSTPYRQSIMKKKSTPAGTSVRKLRSRVSFRSPAEITPAKETSFHAHSPAPTPYRSAEESIATTNSSTDDVYETPYVDHVVRKSTGETPYRLSDVKTDLNREMTESAGSTPFKVMSAEPAEIPDETVEDELNGTFTMETDENEEAGDARADTSTRQPLSCLKTDTNVEEISKNVARTRKSVSFVVSKKKRTATPLRKTPHKSDASRSSHLVSWLEKRGRSISSYRHLHCLGAEPNSSLHKHSSTKRARKSTPKARHSAKKSDLGASPSLQPQASEEVNGTTDIASVLKELYSLLKNGYSSDHVHAWLDALDKEVVQSYPAYWMCRSLACENSQDFTAALNWLMEGLEHLKVADQELLQELELLVNRASAKENTSPTSSKKTARRKLRANDVSPANIFESTRLDYAVFEDSHINRICAAAAGNKTTARAVMTPVRRSTRTRKNVSKVKTPQADLLFKKNPALSC
ncbi:proteoglycan 4-like isoform X2 [Ornithodoros turicata]|uniref:proteoglycan 4-like isoform X2 n=1 Tax=Ornithodoros turicata TaxID=34597 RepID=UPI00313A15B4